MFNSPVLDLVILLSFIYFIGSLILSALNEALSGALRLRPKQLQRSLENLFFGGGWTAFVQKNLVTSPHIESLMKSSGVYPSYIPSQNFVLAIIGEIGAANYTPTEVLNAINGNTTFPPQFKAVLADLWAQANNDLSNFEKSLSGFYNNAMDRAGGVYKKRIRLILIGLGFLIAFFMNLDTIRISQDALANKQQLSQTVDKIVSQLPNIKVNKDSLATINIKMKSGEISIIHTQPGKDTSSATTKIQKNLNSVTDLKMYLQENSGVSVGYQGWCDFKRKWNLKQGQWGDFFLAMLGILITTFALQMSSSFWFDLMNKAVNVRAAGKKPENGTK